MTDVADYGQPRISSEFDRFGASGKVNAPARALKNRFEMQSAGLVGRYAGRSKSHTIDFRPTAVSRCGTQKKSAGIPEKQFRRVRNVCDS